MSSVRSGTGQTPQAPRTRQDGDAGPDVLAGWDPSGLPPVLDGRAPFPTDTVVALAAMVIGVGTGLAIGGRHPFVRAKVGGLLGLTAAIVVRRMWRLPG
jgi:hypothetical protein